MVLAENRQSFKHPRLRTKTRPVLRSRTKLNAVTCLKIVGIILFGFAFGLFYTYKHSQVAAIGYRIESTKQNIAVLQRENRRLELMVAELQRPERVEEIARSKLGMEKPVDILLAAIPPEPDAISGNKAAQTEKNRAQADAWSRIAERLIGRAEASPR